MQQVNDATSALLESYAPLQLRLYGDPWSGDEDIIKAVYTASCCGGTGFSIGTVCAATCVVTLHGSYTIPMGQGTVLGWSVDGSTVYPLIYGIIDQTKDIGGRTEVTICDVLYYASSVPVPADNLSGDVTALQALEAAAQMLGVTFSPGRHADVLRSTVLGDSAQRLAGCNMADAIGELALVAGCSAVISRSGALTLIGAPAAPEDALEADAYAGESKVGEEYQLTGVLLTHEEEHYAAGEGTLALVSVLASQAAADAIVSEWSGVSWMSGEARVFGCLLLEPGDYLKVNAEGGSALTVAHTVELSIDGGCSASIKSLGRGPSESYGQRGQLTKTVDGLIADVLQVKKLYADYMEAVEAKIASLTADDAFVKALFAKNISGEKLRISMNRLYGTGVQLGVSHPSTSYAGATLTMNSDDTPGMLVSVSESMKVSGVSTSKDVKFEVSGIGVAISSSTLDAPLSVNGVPILHVVTGATTSTVTVAASTCTTFDVTFGVTFKSVPHVTPSFRSGSTSANFGRAQIFVVHNSVSKTGCQIRVANNYTSTFSPYIQWVAIGNI